MGSFHRAALMAMALAVTACAEDLVPTSTAGQLPSSASNTQAPVISELLSRDEAAGTKVLQVKATDPGNSALTYSWKAEKGTLSATTGPSVLWRPPAEAGTYTITVEVANGKGFSRLASQAYKVAGDGGVNPSGGLVLSPAGSTGGAQSPGQFQVPSPIVGGNSFATPGASPSFAPPFTQPVVTPSGVVLISPGPTGSPALPTPTPPVASPTPFPTPTPKPATPQPGVPVPPPSRWVQVNSQSVPTTKNLQAVFFVPGALDEGWAVGTGGTILHTEDGGLSWVLRNTGVPVGPTLTDVFFTSANEGFILADTGLVMRTLDHGQTWQDISPVGFGALNGRQLVVYNAQILEVIDSQGRVLRSENGNAAAPTGVSWNRIETRPPDRPNDQVSFIRAGAAFPEATETTLAWFVGDSLYRQDTDNPTASQIWSKSLQFSYSSGYGSAIFMVGQPDIWVGTDAGFVFHSLNGGTSWTQISTFFNREHNGNDRYFSLGPINQIQFVDARNGWFLTGQGIYDTADAGVTWKKTALPGNMTDFQIESRYVGSDRQFFGWGVGASGAIYRYVPN